MLQGDPSSEEVLKFLEEGEESVGGGGAKGGRVHKGVVPISRQALEEVPREDDLSFRCGIFLRHGPNVLGQT